MHMKNRIHIFGASGSGTSTIAKLVSERLNYTHFDTDSYYWYKTDTPFTESRPIPERLQLMNADLTTHDKWILSGSLDGWGNPLVPLFELVVYVYVPPDIRVERLKKRELERYGSISESSKEFIDWAAAYDLGTRTGRSLPRHEQWMAGLGCKLIKIVNNSLDESVQTVLDAIRS